MAIHVTLVGRKDLKGEVYRQLRAAIRTGQLRPGEQLTPSRELARALAVSRSTVVAAYDRLAAEGFVISRAGAGTIMCDGAAHARPEARTKPYGVLRPRSIWQSVDLPTWRKLVARALRSAERAETVYQNIAGQGSLRRAIARHIGIARGVEAYSDNIVVTAGT